MDGVCVGVGVGGGGGGGRYNNIPAFSLKSVGITIVKTTYMYLSKVNKLFDRKILENMYFSFIKLLLRPKQTVQTQIRCCRIHYVSTFHQPHSSVMLALFTTVCHSSSNILKFKQISRWWNRLFQILGQVWWGHRSLKFGQKCMSNHPNRLS